jgi:8-oxo-dGTP pyrophosphatase MutT (NUDIX family)
MTQKPAPDQSSAEITAISSRIAYENRWLRVREDIVRRRDGSQGLYGVVERSDFVVVVPLQDGRVTLVEQYRYPVRRRLWELPMGTWEDTPCTDPAALAAAELAEETGLRAGRMTHAGLILQGPGYCNQVGHVFLATELVPGPVAREPSEQGMISRDFTLAELDAMICDGVMVDGMTLAAVGLLRAKRMLP